MDKQLTVHQMVPVQRVPKENVTALDSRVLCGAAGGCICWRVFALTFFFWWVLFPSRLRLQPLSRPELSSSFLSSQY